VEQYVEHRKITSSSGEALCVDAVDREFKNSAHKNQSTVTGRTGGQLSPSCTEKDDDSDDECDASSVTLIPGPSFRLVCVTITDCEKTVGTRLSHIKQLKTALRCHAKIVSREILRFVWYMWNTSSSCEALCSNDVDNEFEKCPENDLNTGTVDISSHM